MTWIVAGISAAIALSGGVYSSQAAKRAQNRAKKESAKDAANARRAEVFAEKEGEGVGQLGEVKLQVDDEIVDEEENLRAGKSSLRI